MEQLSTLLSPGKDLGEVDLLLVDTEEKFLLHHFHLNRESNGLAAGVSDALRVGISKSEHSLHPWLRCSLRCRAAHGQQKGFLLEEGV